MLRWKFECMENERAGRRDGEKKGGSCVLGWRGLQLWSRFKLFYYGVDEKIRRHSEGGMIWC